MSISWIKWNWIKQSFRLFGSLSIISLLTLKKREFFKRILSDTNRGFHEAWGKCLNSITPQELTGIHRKVEIVFDRDRVSLGIKELVPILEVVRLTEVANILEIGTSSGGTTWHLASNIVPNGEITTVDLSPETSGDSYLPTTLATERPTKEQLGRYFQGTLESARIKQVLIDSRDLMSVLNGEKFDLIFIDGAHTYEYVKKDTENALKLIKDCGYIVWHDYFVFHPDYGVHDYLHELSKTIPIYRLCDSLCAIARISS